MFNILFRKYYGSFTFCLKNLILPPAIVFNLPAKNAAYLRIPRTGSSFIMSQLLQQNPILKHLTQLHPTTMNVQSKKFLQRKIKPAENQPLLFTIVRNPFDRILSVYHHIYLPAPYIYQHYLWGFIPAGLSFVEFLLKVEKIPDRLRDWHIRSQYGLIKPFLKYKPLIFSFDQLEKKDALAEIRSIGLNFNSFSSSSKKYHISDVEQKLIKKIYYMDFQLIDFKE